MKSKKDQQKKDLNFDYKYGFSMPEDPVFKAKKGLTEETVRQISAIKKEPLWMTEFRLKAYKIFLEKKMPKFGPSLDSIDFENIYYYLKPTVGQATSWEDLPKEIKNTYDRIGVPEAEKDFLAGVSAQYECIAGDSLIFTHTGVIQMKDIQPGMYVYSLNELSKKLEKQKVKALVNKGVQQVYKLLVAGRELDCTENHPFLTLNYDNKMKKKRGNFSTQWKYLSELTLDDYIAIAKSIPHTGKSYTIPHISFKRIYTGKNQYGTFTHSSNVLDRKNNRHLLIPTNSSESLMWLFGLYLGDGYITLTSKKKKNEVLSFAIPKTQPNIRKRIQRSFKEVFNYSVSEGSEQFRLRIYSQPIITQCKALGFIGNARTKALPLWVFDLPTSEKLACIGGYIDSDGYMRNGNKNSDINITSINKALLKSVKLLVISCGLRVAGIHSFTYTRASKKTIGYRLQITGDLSPLMMHSEKVMKGFQPRKYYQSYNSHHKSPLTSHTSEHMGFAQIKEIKKLEEKTVYDIEVEGHHNFVANGIIVHNSEVVYESVTKELTKQGVIFCDMDTALREHEEIVKEYFGTLIPPHDNKFAALNSSVWSGGSFVYVPKGAKVTLPLQAYFRINAERFGQFERTLIIAEEGSDVHYVEGCTAPIYTTESLHAAVVEIFVKKDAHVRYTTVQNWSTNIYNLVTKRTDCGEKGFMEWIDCNIGSAVTMKYPSVYLRGEGARGEVLSIAFAGRGQTQDAGAKMLHFAPNTSSRIVSKSISKEGGRTSYRGLVQISPGATNSSVYVSCDALILDEESRSDTYPVMKIKENEVEIQHEATVEKLGDEKLFYLMSRGLSRPDAESALVLGFMEPVTKEIPLEYTVELNRLIRLEMEGSVG